MRQDEWTTSFPFGDIEVDPNQLVFHYTSLDRAASLALGQQMFLSPLAHLNDPRERDSVSPIGMWSGLGAGPADEVRQKVHDDLAGLRASIRVACFSRDGDAGAPGSLERSDDRGFARSRMWAQYGAGHAGACICFDRTLLIERANELSSRAESGNVTYRAGFDGELHRAGMVDFDAVDIEQQHRSVIDSLFSKNSDWAAEREFRIVVDGWRESVCGIDISGAVCGLAVGGGLLPHQTPAVEALRVAFGLERHGVALLHHLENVLVALPAYGPDDEVHRWTPSDLKDPSIIFDQD